MEQKRVLCIEDERFIGELYQRALEKAGFAVNIIADGSVGLQEALSDQYDIILLDIMVPQLLGIDILQKLRSDKPDLKAKIIITTNLEQDEETRSRVEQQADGYLIKAEITPNQLADFLKQIK